MARKREIAPENEGEQPGTDGATLAPRMSVQLDADGGIAWDRMRPDNRDRLRAALGKLPAPEPATAAPKAQTFPPALCETLYDSLSMLLMGLARRGGFTTEQASVLAFTPQEKGALVPATIKVLDKYDTSLGKYQEEIVLGVLFSTIITGKLTLLRKQATVMHMVAPSTSGAESQQENPPGA